MDTPEPTGALCVSRNADQQRSWIPRDLAWHPEIRTDTGGDRRPLPHPMPAVWVYCTDVPDQPHDGAHAHTCTEHPHRLPMIVMAEGTPPDLYALVDAEARTNSSPEGRRVTRREARRRRVERQRARRQTAPMAVVVGASGV